MCQPAGIGYLLGLRFEHINEALTDNLALLFGLAHPGQLAIELVAGIHTDNIQPQTFVILHHMLKLILAEQAMIHKDTSKPVADSLVQQDSRYR